MRRATLSFAIVFALAFVTTAHAAVLVDAPLTNTSQVRTAANNPFNGNYVDLAAVNFLYTAPGGSSSGTVNGVAFDDIDLVNGSFPTSHGPWQLFNNGGGSLALNFPFTTDNTQRTQNLAAAGPDAANLNSIANEIFYVSFAGAGHDSATMTFSGLGGNRPVYVQLIGGDSGWNGVLNVTANGVDTGADWTTVANSSVNVGSIYGFDATTNASGQLSVALNISGGNFAGLGGLLISGDPAGYVNPPAAAFTQYQLTNTAQLLAPDPGFPTLAAAVNLRYSNQPGVAGPGSVNGVPFQDVDWLVAGAAPIALAQGGTLKINPSYADGTGRARGQGTSFTILGPNDTVLESIANTINFLNTGESVTFDVGGLFAGRGQRIQLIGGDDGATFNNWLGDLNVLVNGTPVGLWDEIANDDRNSASIATFYGFADATGHLQVTLVNPSTAAPFAGLAALVVTQANIPEPATLTMLGLAGLGLLRRRRK